MPPPSASYADRATPRWRITSSATGCRRRKTRHLRERFIEFVLFCAAAFSVAITLGIVYVLVSESVLFFQHVSLWDFLTDTQWTPLFDDAHYGIMLLLSGTLVSSAVALLVAVPLGTIIAIYLSEFAPFSRARGGQALAGAALSGVPTVVYGYFALLFVTPLLQKLHSRACRASTCSPPGWSWAS